MNYKEVQRLISESILDTTIIRKFSKDGARCSVLENEVYKDFGFSNTECRIHHFWFNIAFYELEKILCPIIVNNSLFGSYGYTYEDNHFSFTVDVDIKNQLPCTEDGDGHKIKSEKDLTEICNLFVKFYEEDVLPYFNKWHSLVVLYDYIKTKDEEELWGILGQFSPMSKAIIYHLCNDELGLVFVNKYYQEQKGYYDEDPNDLDNINYYKAATQLKEVLENTEPIYNIEV